MGLERLVGFFRKATVLFALLAPVGIVDAQLSPLNNPNNAFSQEPEKKNLREGWRYFGGEIKSDGKNEFYSNSSFLNLEGIAILNEAKARIGIHFNVCPNLGKEGTWISLGDKGDYMQIVNASEKGPLFAFAPDNKIVPYKDSRLLVFHPRKNGVMLITRREKDIPEMELSGNYKVHLGGKSFNVIEEGGELKIEVYESNKFKNISPIRMDIFHITDLLNSKAPHKKYRFDLIGGQYFIGGK